MKLFFIIIISFYNLYSQDQYENSYFPLRVGYTWKYEKDGYNLCRHVKKIIEENGMHFALIEETATIERERKYHRTKLFRCNEKNNIELLISDYSSLLPKLKRNESDSSISVWFKFDAKLNESWEAFDFGSFSHDYIDEYEITLLSKTDTVVCKDTTYTNCYRFYSHDLGERDTGYYEWFAKDIGLVKRGDYLLTSFKKNDNTIYENK